VIVRLGRSRQRRGEARSFFGRRSDVDAAAVSTDDPLDDVKPESQAGSVRPASKWLEQSREPIGRYRWPFIMDVDGHFLCQRSTWPGLFTTALWTAGFIRSRCGLVCRCWYGDRFAHWPSGRAQHGICLPAGLSVRRLAMPSFSLGVSVTADESGRVESHHWRFSSAFRGKQLRSTRVENLPRSSWIADWRRELLDSVAEASQLADHLAGAYFLASASESKGRTRRGPR
jgi:hypothetical protein